jgi:hypothetical protein
MAIVDSLTACVQCNFDIDLVDHVDPSSLRVDHAGSTVESISSTSMEVI